MISITMMILNSLARRQPLLANNRNYRWVWASTIFTAFEEIMSFTVMPLYILNLTGSGAMLAFMWAVQTLPALLVGPAASVVADRFNRKRVWLVASYVVAVTYALYAFTQSIEQLFALIVVVAMGLPFARNAYLALMPDVVAERELIGANALISMNFNIALTIAPLIAGALVAASGAQIAFCLLALMRLMGIVCMSRIRYTPSAKAAKQTAAGRTWLTDLRAGVQYARAHVAVRALLLTALGTNLGGGGLVVLEAILIKQVLNAGDQGYGLMLSCAGVGAIAGSLLMKPTTARWPLLRVCAAAVLLTGVSFFPYANILWFPITLVIATVQTLTWMMGNILMETFIQQHVPEALRGRVLGLLLVIRNGMTLLAMAIFGPIVDSVGAVLLLNVAGVIYTLAGIYAWLAFRQAATPAPQAVTSAALSAGVED